MSSERRIVSMLLIEDNDTYASFVKETLSQSQYFEYHITHVTSIEKACEKLRAQLNLLQFDVILLDLVLPNGEGVALVEQVRRYAPKSRTAIVVITGFNDEDTELEAREALANDYVRKDGLTPERLLRIMRNWAIWSVGCREAREKMQGMERVAQDIAETIKTCESTVTLPPYPQ